MSEDAALIPSIPLELIELLIIPYSAASWLRVSKKYNIYALNYVVNYPAFLINPKRALTNAVSSKNYALLDALLSDERYRAKYVLSQVMPTCLTDKSATMVVLKYCYNTNWIVERIVAKAIDDDQIDLMEHLLNHKDIRSIDVKSFYGVSKQMFELLVPHPKLEFFPYYLETISSNNAIPNSIKLNVMQLPDVDISMLIGTCACHEEFVDVLLEDQRVKESVSLQESLWNKIIGTKSDCGDIYQYYDKCAKVRMILEKKLLDPSIDSNFPLMRVFGDKNFNQEQQKIAQMLLDDDRVVIALEPYTNNLIYIAIASNPTDLTAKIKCILSHPKYNTAWFESVMTYLLDQQSLLKTIDNISRIFNEHQFDQFLSEEIRARAPKAIKQLQRMHAYHYNYFDEPGFYSAEEDEQNNDGEDEDALEDPSDEPVE